MSSSKPDAPEPSESGQADSAGRDSATDSRGSPDDTAPCDPTSWYPDDDGDGWGLGDPEEACEPPSGSWAEHDGDCDDGDAATYPGARWEPCGEDVDRNCDGAVNGSDGECDPGMHADSVIEFDSDENWPGLDAAWLGDIDADGRDDVVLSAPGFMCMNEREPGYARVYTAAQFDVERDIDIDAEADAAVTIESVHDGWCFGDSAASAGDVDGDGLDDLVVGESARPSDYDAYSNPDPGNVYVFLAAEFQPFLVASDAAAVIGGLGQYDSFGGVVGPIGDVDGDGYADVYGLGGGDTRLLLGHSLVSGHAEDEIYIRSQIDYEFNHGVPGDVDGDGFDDVAGAAGEVWLGSGLTPGTTISAADADYLFASSPAVGADLDGDGLADIVAHFDYVQHAVYRWTELQGAADPAAITVDDASLVLTFTEMTFLQSHGDLDGDGVGDLLANRSYLSEVAYGVVSGATFRNGGTLAVEELDTEWWNDGMLVTRYDWTTSRADGDLDGDGVNEILLGTKARYAFILRDW